VSVGCSPASCLRLHGVDVPGGFLGRVGSGGANTIVGVSRTSWAQHTNGRLPSKRMQGSAPPASVLEVSAPKRALVTGTSSGIGLATALRLAQEGFEVFAGMRDISRASDLQTAAAARGLDVAVISLDVDDDASVASAFAGVGALDVLVNNAGICPLGPIEEMPLAEWKAIFETNLFGAVRCTQAALPAMRKRGFGHIVNISSVSSVCTPPIFGAYAASKAALEAASEALAAEVAPFGIAVSIVVVGAVKTAMQKKAAPPPTAVYRQALRNGGLFAAHLHSGASDAEVIAEAVTGIVSGSVGAAPLRTPAGHGAAELCALDAQLGAAERNALFALPTSEFLRGWEERTGQDLTQHSRV